MSSSSAIHPSVASTTMTTASAPAAAALLRSTPIASTSSLVSPRIPAVSRSVTGSPPTSTDASTTSLVVPATGVTIARSLLLHAFNNELFPALGRPTMATETPV